MRRTHAMLVVLVGTLSLTTACGGKSSDGAAPASSTQTTMMIPITITGESVDPNGTKVDVSPGQPVELDVTADAPGEIHVHSTPEHEYEYVAGSGDDNHFTFTIDQPGQIDIESHTLDKLIVTLVVG